MLLWADSRRSCCATRPNSPRLLDPDLRSAVARLLLELGDLDRAEAQARRGQEELEPVALDAAVAEVQARWNALP